jgi:hypothetical protein
MKSKIVVMLLAAGFMPTAFADNVCKQVDDKGEVTFIDCAKAEKGAEKVKIEKPNTVSMPKGSIDPIQSQSKKPKPPQTSGDANDIAPLDGNNVYVDDDILRRRRIDERKRDEYREERKEKRREDGSVYTRPKETDRPKETHRPIATPRPAAPRLRPAVR